MNEKRALTNKRNIKTSVDKQAKSLSRKQTKEEIRLEKKGGKNNG